ncbi:sushi, nidogen and EGF-like domain-containing protein 1 [Cyprinodon tularosa]|uniref:sushi, nidogen and EGF-like domain-containing protein 1 n=1 Tax=Cyprinodon tularosa TaxID=77115 RepID=UPI0018E1F4A5|nr:sushi, nidogen and EGF-like domain-containing protein 1 [Cyprinodon tularosa]XP_038138320.1 sushi, nidogen and EGF-like domain-containing protein 1 [Cyprinodon tularosa]
MLLVLQAILSCFCTLLPRVEPAVSLEDFYPFGPDQGDTQTIAQDDGGSGLQEISVAFPFFGDRHSGLYVNNNGLVSFLREVSQFTPVAFPIAGDRRVVAPFWADVDNRLAGSVFFRESQDSSILRRASGDVRTYFAEFPDFNATWVLISTWHQVTFFGGNSQTPVNTFQVVLITDGELSFTIFQYNNITWTTGRHASSGGNLEGLGGIAAQAGFNAGDGKRYFNIPGSRTADVVSLEETTNVGYPGRWVFRIDDANVEVGGCNSASVCPHLRPCLNGGQCIDDCITGNPSFTCSCLAGFTGRRCQINVNECASDPCQNGGSCKDQINGFICECPPGYAGIHCQTDVDECEGRPCLNNATCVQGTGNFTCVCELGYTGLRCETDINECESSPCLNGGECIDQVNGFTCTCPAAFTGTFCQTAKCLCQNGGVCVGINGTCECPPGYTGAFCQLGVTQTLCSNSRTCPDGSPCLEYGGYYVCTCHTGVQPDPMDFYPVQPQSVCDSSPCLNGGYCYERDGGYTCECRYGYSGKHCEKVRLNTCASSPCRNGGSCKEEGGGYRCVCPYRFTGKHCEVGKPDPCSSTPCLNGGTCFHYLGKYKCECTDEYEGKDCQIRRSSLHPSAEPGCGPPPHVKHAEVQFSSTTPGSIAEYVCHPGFASVPRAAQSLCSVQGEWSQPPVCKEINECLSQPCLNGGSCQNKIGSYKCVCLAGFSGKHCQIEQDGCESSPCLNGGVCRGYRQYYVCTCKDGFFGERCQMLEDPCVLKPCGARGSCWSDKRGNYNCICKVGLTGKDCEKDLLPPSGLHVLRVEENEVELRWDQQEHSHRVISIFAVTYAPVGNSTPKTDYLDKQQTTHVLRDLAPGMLYNISTVSIRLKAYGNDTSQPATALIRTRPPRVEKLQLVNVSSSHVWLSWLVQAAHHAAVSRVHVSITPSDGTEALTVALNASITEHSFSSLKAGHMYTVDVLTQSGIRPDEFPSTSHSAGPLQFWTRPHPPENLSLSHVTPNSALITWTRHPRHVPDGFVINVTRGLNTRSRFLPNGKLGSYTFRELTPGQHYNVALMSVKNTGHQQIHSIPQHLSFTTLPVQVRPGRRERPLLPGRVFPTSHPQDLGATADIKNSGELFRYTELVDRRGKITAKFSHLTPKVIRHRTRPPPIRLEKMEETTNKISLALEIGEKASRTQPESSQDCRSLSCQNGGTCVEERGSAVCSCATGFKGRQCELLCQRLPHPCTRLYSETKSIPVWEGGVCHYLYRRTYKVQQDVCYREVCEPMLSTRNQNRRVNRPQ